MRPINYKHSNNAAIVSRLLRRRYRSKDEICELLEHDKTSSTHTGRCGRRRPLIQQAKQQQEQQYYITGIKNGNYYRLKIPTETTTDVSILPPLKPLYSMVSRSPQSFKPVEIASSTAATTECSTVAVAGKESLSLVKQQNIEHQTGGSSSHSHHHGRNNENWHRIKDWLIENYATLILNVGSICSLIGFTRSDVLELRSLSVVGSVCACFYNCTLHPLRATPILWSLTFAVVNSFKIYEILEERDGTVNLNEEQQQRYVQFFLPHGITPKQFSIIDNKAEKLNIPKGSVIIRQNECIDYIYLIVRGTTRASTLGRYLTAVSMSGTNASNSKQQSSAAPNNRNMTSGAWIGEMKFLQHIGSKEYNTEHRPKRKITAASTTSPKDSHIPVENEKKDEIQLQDIENPYTDKSLYTIIAQEDCYVLRWTFADMEELLDKSPDMRTALIRAMTDAVVGKVINFTMSRRNLPPEIQNPVWKNWFEQYFYHNSNDSTNDTKPVVTNEKCEKHQNTSVNERGTKKQIDMNNLGYEDVAVVAAEPKLPKYPMRNFQNEKSK